MSMFSKVLRAGEGKKVRRLAELVPLVNALEPEMEARSDEELQAMTAEFRERLANGEILEDVLVESFALVREAAWRVLGQRHFDAQLMGGMALHFGWIAEMKTGEGKTLVSTLPVYLNALAGNGVHVVTVNDYLATRDSEWMGRLHQFLGLTVGRVGPDISDPAESAPRTTPTSRTAPTPSSGSTTCGTTWPGPRTPWSNAATSSPSSTRWTRSSSTRPGHR